MAQKGSLEWSTSRLHLEQIQGVAVNWVFSSRIKFVGLEVILGS